MVDVSRNRGKAAPLLASPPRSSPTSWPARSGRPSSAADSSNPRPRPRRCDAGRAAHRTRALQEGRHRHISAAADRGPVFAIPGALEDPVRDLTLRSRLRRLQRLHRHRHRFALLLAYSSPTTSTGRTAVSIRISGGAGTSRCRSGCVTTSTSPWGEIAVGCVRRIVNSSDHDGARRPGTGRRGRSWSGARFTGSGWPPSALVRERRPVAALGRNAWPALQLGRSLRAIRGNQIDQGRYVLRPVLPRRRAWLGRVCTFHFVCFGWVLFRAESSTRAALCAMIPAASTTAIHPMVLLVIISIAVQYAGGAPGDAQASEVSRWPRRAAQGIGFGGFGCSWKALGPQHLLPVLTATACIHLLAHMAGPMAPAEPRRRPTASHLDGP